jgi:hypothetical protein
MATTTKFDLKQYMRANPERAALFACGVVTGALMITGVIMWFRASNAKKNAQALAQPTTMAERGLSDPNNVPQGPPDLPDPAREQARLADFSFKKIELPARFGGPDAFAGDFPTDDRRRQPALLLPVEGRGKVVMTQLRSYIFDDKGEKVAVLEGGSKDSANDMKRLGGLGSPMGTGGPRGQGGQRNFYNFGNMGGRGGLSDPRQPQNVESARPAAKKSWVPLDKLEDEKDSRLAEAVRPLRMAIMVASFPYKQQLDEFKNKLNLRTYSEVLSELSMEKAPAEGPMGGGRYLPSFRFKGVSVQRRVVDATGKPLARQPKTIDPEDPDGTKELPVEKDGWVTLKPGPAYKPYVFITGKRLEEEDDKKLDAVMFDGLVMPRLLQMRGSQYPALEKDLDTLKEAMKKVNEKADPKTTGKPNNFNTDNFDEWSIRRDNAAGPGQGPGAGPAHGGPAHGGNPRDRQPMPPGQGMPDSGERRDGRGTYGEIDPVTHCLVRVIDVTVKPGYIYQYRLQVRLANPNYKRESGLASVDFAKEPDLTSDQWFVLPDLFAVPPELAVYAVDQKKIDGVDDRGREKYKGINAAVNPDKNAAVLQVHRWLENVPLPGGGEKLTVNVGEWSVAERLIVERGEVIDRYSRVEVPIWSDTRESWVIMPAAEKNRRGTDVFFGDPVRPSVLADFEPGEHSHPRVRREEASSEVLILSPDGRLLAHEAVSDGDSKDRKDRVDAWRKRIEDVRSGKANEGGGNTPNDPKGPTRPPFGGGGNPRERGQ